MQVGQNETVSRLLKRYETIRLMVESLQEEIAKLKVELDVSRAQLAEFPNTTVEEPLYVREELQRFCLELDQLRTQGAMGATVSAPRVEVPRSDTYSGVRKVCDIKNFPYGLERYFALDIIRDAAKLRTTPLYLKDLALVWWWRSYDDIRKGSDAVTFWNMFKSKLKNQF